MKYMVVTHSGWQVFGPRDLDACKRYVSSARSRGALPGSLRIVPAKN